MKIQVRYFGALRDQAGIGSESIETAATSAIGVYRELLERGKVHLPERLIKFVKGGKFVGGNEPVADGDVLEFLPPAAGG